MGSGKIKEIELVVFCRDLSIALEHTRRGATLKIGSSTPAPGLEQIALCAELGNNCICRDG
jgi:hypothetical protein